MRQVKKICLYCDYEDFKKSERILEFTSEVQINQTPLKRKIRNTCLYELQICEINKTETLNTERNFSQLFISQKQPGYLIVFRIHNLFNPEPTNCLSVFDHFVELRLRELIKQ